MPCSLIRRSPLPNTRSSELALSSASAYSVADTSDPLRPNNVVVSSVPGSNEATIPQSFESRIPSRNGLPDRLTVLTNKLDTGPDDMAATATLNGLATPPTSIGRSSDFIDLYEAISTVEVGSDFGVRKFQTRKAKSYDRPTHCVVGWSFPPGSEYPFVDLNLDSWKAKIVTEELCEKKSNTVDLAHLDSKVSPKEPAHYAIRDTGHRNATGQRNELALGTSEDPALAGEIFGSTKYQANSKDPIAPALGDTLESDRPSDARPAARSAASQQADVAGNQSDIQCCVDEREPFNNLLKPVYPVRSLSRPKLHTLLPPKLARRITQESLETLNVKSGLSMGLKARRRIVREKADATNETVRRPGFPTQVRSNIASMPTTITPQMILSSSYARAAFSGKRQFTDETVQLVSAISPKMLKKDTVSTAIDIKQTESRRESSLDVYGPTEKLASHAVSRQREAPVVVHDATEVSELGRSCVIPLSSGVNLVAGRDLVDYRLVPFGGVCIDTFWPPHSHATSTAGRVMHKNDSSASVLTPLNLNNGDSKQMMGSSLSPSVGISKASSYQGIKRERDCEECASEDEFPQAKRSRIF